LVKKGEEWNAKYDKTRQSTEIDVYHDLKSFILHLENQQGGSVFVENLNDKSKVKDLIEMFN
jgi:hypothetical protein